VKAKPVAKLKAALVMVAINCDKIANSTWVNFYLLVLKIVLIVLKKVLNRWSFSASYLWFYFMIYSQHLSGAREH